MQFFDRILNALKDKEIPLPRVENWIAVNQSRQSALTRLRTPAISWLPSYFSANEAIAVLFLCLFMPSWECWEIIDRIKESAYFQRYSGKWNQVQEILEQVSNIEEFEEYIDRTKFSHEFFGNYLEIAEKVLRRNQSRFKPFERDRTYRPRRLIRHRGYRDKGSLRPPHTRGRELPDPNPGEDRREKVRFGTSDHLKSLERVGRKVTSQKGGIYDGYFLRSDGKLFRYDGKNGDQTSFFQDREPE